ncbi:15-hydroxyprostaglandin dehydrogenase [NAD(+)]-like isoform X2 [Chiloscyllium punctatum]|uniref:15-hydroxyprostaglandin dehydrogenase [NAD(+)]-like isoform X2 n=1 Tax=Chiloscyllium punctatum TaxID=137246 RepID=UPI003B640D9D
MSLVGKVALITGAAQGLGKAFAEILLKNGAKVSLLDISTAVGLKTKTTFDEVYGAQQTMFITCDVTSGNQLKDAFKKTIENFLRLDIVCNNAGIADETNWQRCLDLNLVSVIRGTYLGLDCMNKKTGGAGGVIINVSSMAGSLCSRESWSSDQCPLPSVHRYPNLEDYFITRNTGAVCWTREVCNTGSGGIGHYRPVIGR